MAVRFSTIHRRIFFAERSIYPALTANVITLITLHFGNSAECLFQYLLCVVFRIDLLDYLGQYALLVEDECLAERAHIFTAIETLFCPNTKGLLHLGSCIGEKCKWKFEFIDKFAV